MKEGKISWIQEMGFGEVVPERGEERRVVPGYAEMSRDSDVVLRVTSRGNSSQMLLHKKFCIKASKERYRRRVLFRGG